MAGGGAYGNEKAEKVARSICDGISSSGNSFASILIYAHSKLNLIQYDDGTIEQDVTISAGEEDELDLDLSGLESAAPPDVPDGEYTAAPMC